jgi:hypothetical protein
MRRAPLLTASCPPPSSPTVTIAWRAGTWRSSSTARDSFNIWSTWNHATLVSSALSHITYHSVLLSLQHSRPDAHCRYGLTREQLAMVALPRIRQSHHRKTCQVSVLMSRQAQHHPAALTRVPHTLAQVLAAPSVAPVTGILECARRSDGGAALLLASTRFLVTHGLQNKTCPVFISGAEASGPLFPPDEITESMFSCDDAARAAYVQAHLGPSDIDFFGLYDCFPICFIRAIEGLNRRLTLKASSSFPSPASYSCWPRTSRRWRKVGSGAVPQEVLLPPQTISVTCHLQHHKTDKLNRSTARLRLHLARTGIGGNFRF